MLGQPRHGRAGERRRGGRRRDRRELVLFAFGGGVVYLSLRLGVTLVLGVGLPVLGWVGFSVVAAVVLAASTALAVFLVRATASAGGEPPWRRPPATAGVRRLLVVVDERCPAHALRPWLAGEEPAPKTDVLVVAPALVSPVR